MNKKYFLIGFFAVAAVLLIMLIRMGRVISETPVPIQTPVPTNNPEQVSSSEIIGSWKWSKTTMNDGKIITPNKPEAFVANFEEGGNLSSTTDCNSMSGSYKLLPDFGIQISDMASTLMYCEGSQEAEYSQALQSANKYKISGEELWLMLPVDSGTMIFTRANLPN